MMVDLRDVCESGPLLKRFQYRTGSRCYRMRFVILETYARGGVHKSRWSRADDGITQDQPSG